MPVESCICQLNTSLQEGEKTTCITYMVPANGFCVSPNLSLLYELNFTSRFGRCFLSKALKKTKTRPTNQRNQVDRRCVSWFDKTQI